jgi:DNA-binding transcriptional ArsR family regulator
VPVDVFVAVAEPTRRRLLDELLDGERTVGELVGRLRLNQPTVSKHLRVLKEAGLVSSRADAQRRCYRIEPSGFGAIETWMAAYRGLWNRRLDALEAHLDRKEQR